MTGDGEGAEEFHNYEGGGIGEGKGTKDVSDKIENEDQVMEIMTFELFFCQLVAGRVAQLARIGLCANKQQQQLKTIGYCMSFY